MNLHIKIFLALLILISLPAITRAQFHILVPRDGYVSDTITRHHHKDTTAHRPVKDTTAYRLVSDSLPRYYQKRKWAAFHYPGKQYFFEGEAVLTEADFGVRFIAGYRLGQLGILGGGIGIEGLIGALTANNITDPYNGLYIPVFAHYEGDILKKWVTPYYAVEAGYGFRYTSSSNNDYIEVTPVANTPVNAVYKYYGGFTGAFDFGVKFYVRHKAFIMASATLDVQQAADKYSSSFTNSVGQNISLSNSSSTFLLMPGLKIACGF
jgi:hypothetical protein